jgi:hypothetical protein
MGPATDHNLRSPAPLPRLTSVGRENLLAEFRQTVALLTTDLASSRQTVASLTASHTAALANAKRKGCEDLANTPQAALTQYMGDAIPPGPDAKRRKPNGKSSSAAETKRGRTIPPTGEDPERAMPSHVIVATDIKATPAAKPKRIKVTAPTREDPEESLPSPMVVAAGSPADAPPMSLADAPAQFIQFDETTYRSAFGPGAQGYEPL